MKRLFLLSVFIVVGTGMIFSQSITVTHPGTGDTWIVGSLHQITWNKAGNMNANVKIRLFKGETKISNIVDSTPNSGSYNWSIPNSLNAGTYKIRVKTVDNSVSDDGDPFNISKMSTITITHPGTGDTWNVGSSYQITWNKTGNMNANVKIRLFKGGTKISDIIDSTPNSGSYSWSIPNSLDAGTYKVRVKTVDNSVSDDGDPFNISKMQQVLLLQQTGTILPTIIVTHPGTGDSWVAGSTHQITWNKVGNMNANVRIGLYKNGVKIWNIINSAPNSGMFNWKIPSGVSSGEYKVRVKTVDNSVSDDGDKFSISTMMYLQANAVAVAIKKHPDFKILKIYASPSNELLVDVANIGEMYSGNIKVKYHICYRFSSGSQCVHPDSGVATNNLILGKNAYEVFHTGYHFIQNSCLLYKVKIVGGKRARIPTSIKSVPVKIEVDPSNDIHETNENNNEFSSWVENIK